MTVLPDLSLSLVLDRAGRELQEQADAVRGLHGLVTRDPILASGGIGEAQTIDLASQYLDALSALLGRIAEWLPSDMALPAALLEPIPLAALRDRMAGLSTQAPESGEIDLF